MGFRSPLKMGLFCMTGRVAVEGYLEKKSGGKEVRRYLAHILRELSICLAYISCTLTLYEMCMLRVKRE